IPDHAIVTRGALVWRQDPFDLNTTNDRVRLESTCEGQQVRKPLLSRSNLIDGGAPNGSLDACLRSRGRNEYTVVVFEADVARCIAAEEVVIEVHAGDQLSTSADLNVSKRSPLRGPACNLERIEYPPGAADLLCTGVLDVTNNEYLI